MTAGRDLHGEGGVPAGALERYFGPQAEQPIEGWPPELMRRYQFDALAEQLAHVYTNSSFYRRKFDDAQVSPQDFHSLQDLRRFPFTSKDELFRDPWILLSVPREDVRLAHTSTGTTGGDWIYILYTWDDMIHRDIAPMPRALMPVGTGDVVVNALPYEMSSSGQSFQRYLQAGAGAMVVPVGKGGFYSDPYKTVKIMHDLGASVLITTPPYAMVLAEAADQSDLKPGDDIRLQRMWLTGEGCSPAYRNRLQELWKCPGLIFYGSMECGSIGIESEHQNGCHVCLGHVYLEIIDPQSGDVLPDGQTGEIVCTVLQRRGSPLIRFRTRDLGLIDSQPDDSGIALPRIHIRGRIADESAGPPGASPMMIEQVLYSQPEIGNNYQIYAREDGVQIDAELQPGAEGPAVAARIAAALAQQNVNAELNWVDHIPRIGGKTRRLRPLAERDEVMSQPSMVRHE